MTDEDPAATASTSFTLVEDDETGVTSLKYYFRGYCDSAKISPVIEMLHDWDAFYPESNWEFVINSEGGEMAHGTALYSTLRRFSLGGGGTHELTTRVAGYACSAAHLVYQAGDIRLGGELDFLMIHEPMACFTDEPTSLVREKLAHADMWSERFVDICLRRCKLTRRTFLAKFTGKDWWIPMDEAVRIGLADAIE